MSEWETTVRDWEEEVVPAVVSWTPDVSLWRAVDGTNPLSMNFLEGESAAAPCGRHVLCASATVSDHAQPVGQLESLCCPVHAEGATHDS